MAHVWSCWCVSVIVQMLQCCYGCTSAEALLAYFALTLRAKVVCRLQHVWAFV